MCTNFWCITFLWKWHWSHAWHFLIESLFYGAIIFSIYWSETCVHYFWRCTIPSIWCVWIVKSRYLSATWLRHSILLRLPGQNLDDLYGFKSKTHKHEIYVVKIYSHVVVLKGDYLYKNLDFATTEITIFKMGILVTVSRLN